MTPDIYNWLSGDSNIDALLGNADGIAVYRDEAPEKTPAPYLCWSIAGGLPNNYLGQAPLLDNVRVQFDAYAKTTDTEAGPDIADAIYRACVAVLELHGYTVSFNGSMRDPDTRNYRVSWDMSFKVYR